MALSLTRCEYLSLPCSPAKIRWLALEKLSGYNPHIQPFEAPRNVAIACFYISVFLFFEMAWEYCREMLYPTTAGELCGGGVSRW